MIFGFGKSREEEIEEEEEEIEYVLFQGPMNGTEVNLKANARLAEAALVPAKELVTDALARRAERFRLEPKGKIGAVTLSVDGIPYSGGKMSAQQAMAVTQMIKLLAGLDIKERKQPQSGGIKAQYQEIPYELSVSVSPAPEGGERLVVNSRNLKSKMETPDDLGFSSGMKSAIRSATSQKKGVVLVCGAPFTGVTTTMYAVLRTVDSYMYSIYSIADAGGRELRGVSEFAVNSGDELTTTFQRIKRLEADLVFLDPLRDADTAKSVCQWADEMGFLCEIPAKETAAAALQWVDWIGDRPLAAERLAVVVQPKLIRTLCVDCREAYRPNPKLIAKVGLPPETTLLYRPPTEKEPENPNDPPPEPCAKCGGMGYFGRAGMYELLVMSDEMRQVVASGGDAAAIKAQARKEKMQSFHQEGLRLVAQGKTSLEELQRVFKSG